VATPTAADWFEHAVRIEASDKAGAEASYRRAIELSRDHVDAYLNLGVLLCDSDRSADAIALYRRAIEHCPDEALLHFNAASRSRTRTSLPSRSSATRPACG
jgi:tetratricopeptide (TPR) repeat protein